MAKRKWADLAAWYYEDDTREVEMRMSQWGSNEWLICDNPVFADHIFYRKKVKPIILNIPAKKLEWKEVDGEFTWKEAMKLAGDGWRLPTKIEVLHLYVSELMPSNRKYWSSTLHANGDCLAWVVSFFNGYDNASNKNNKYYVRLVREID